jgi:acetyltransferase-like isoleucine patch superfamily enzyme
MFIGILKYFYRLLKSEQTRVQLTKKFNTVRISSGLRVTSIDNLTLGEYVDIQTNCYIASNGGVSIGDYTQISENFLVFSDEHLYDTNDYIPISNKKIKKPVKIEDFVVIGTNVSVLPGVTIGRGCIIGMGSVVVNDISPFSIALGNPARVIKKRDEDEFNKLFENKSFFQNIKGDLDYEYTK